MSTTNRVRTLLKNGSLRLIATQSPALVLLSLKLGRQAGADGWRALFRAVDNGIRTRPEVNALCKLRRPDIETRWRKKQRSVLGPTV